MVIRKSWWVGAAVLFALLRPVAAVAEEAASTAEWDPTRVAALAGELHEGVKGLRDEMRAQTQNIGSMQAWAGYRLLDNLRLIERETRYLHRALESGVGREETLPTYARIAMLRRDCAEDMRKQFLTAGAQERIARARTTVKQMDPYYGFDPNRPDHERVLRR